MGGLNPEEARFLRRLVRREEAAFSRFVEQHKAMVLRCTRSILLDDAEAEDAAQDAFVQIFKKIGEFRGESSLKTWVYRIARNIALNRTRSLARRNHGRHQELDGALESQQYTAEMAPSLRADPVREQELRELASSLERALASLDAGWREVLVLRDVEELSYEEIADALELPVGTVKSRIFRARAALRQTLEEMNRGTHTRSEA